MAFETGFVSTASGLLSQLSSFLLGTGWSLNDNPSLSTFSGYNVFFSNGSLSNEDIYIGIGYGLKDYDNPPAYAAWQNQDYNNAQYELLNIQPMQYWDAGSNQATNMINGRVGPVMMGMLDGSSNLEGIIYASYLHPIEPDTNWPGDWINAHASKYNFYLKGGGLDWTGFGRRWYGHRRDDDFQQVDFVTQRLSVPFTQGEEYRSVFAFNMLGEPVVFQIRQNTFTGNIWVERPVGEGAGHSSLTVRANPPAGVVTYNDANLCYDGKNYIYLAGRNSGTPFYRYDIAANTWSTLANFITSLIQPHVSWLINYIPKESTIGTTLGWTSDKIIMKSDSITFIIYDVNGNSWSSLSSAEDLSNYGGTAWDGGKYIYYGRGNNSYEMNRYNIETNTWATIDGLPYIWGTGSRMMAKKSYNSHIVVDTGGSTYWFFADKDHCVVVTKDQQGQYFTTYFGIVDRYYSNQKVTLDNSVTAGNVTLNVTGTFDQWIDGKPLYIYDPSNGGKAERFIPDNLNTGSSTITATLVNNYSAGSKIGVDPQPTIAQCNFWDSAFCVHAYDAPGAFDHPDNPRHVNYMMRLVPTRSEWVNGGLNNAREQIQLWPITLTSWNSFADGNDYNFIDRVMKAATGENKPEVRGQMIGMFALPPGIAPDPESEDEIVVGNNRYIVFKSHTMFDSESGENMYIAVGPKA